MQETLHASFALLMAAGIARRRYWLTFAVIVLASLVRVTWALALIPWVTLFIGQSSKRNVAKLLALATGGTIALFLFARHMTSPFPGLAADFYSRFPYMVGLDRDLSQTIIPNLIRFPFEGPFFLNQVQRIEAIDLIVVGIIGAFYKERAYLFMAASLLFITVPVAALYAGNSYRILFPHLLLAFLVLLSSRQLKAVAVLIILHLAFGLNFLEKFKEFYAPRVDSTVPTSIDGFELMHYDPSAPDAYANTILLPLETLNNSWLALPPGIGITVMLKGYVPHHQSKYILLSPQQTRPQQFASPGASTEAMKELELLCHTKLGDIYVRKKEQAAP